MTLVVPKRPRRSKQLLQYVRSPPAIRFAALPVLAVISLLNTKLIEEAVGPVDYGIVNTVATLATLLPVSDFGVGAAVRTRLAQASPGQALSGTVIAATVATAARRLAAVAAVTVLSLIALALANAWGPLLGSRLDGVDNNLISLAIALYALSTVLSLGMSVLLGVGANSIATLIGLMANAFALAFTVALGSFPAAHITYACSGYIGLLASSGVSTLFAIRILRRDYQLTLRAILRAVPDAKLLAGSAAVLVMNLELPVVLESGRIIVSHLCSANSLSVYAIAAQIYAMLFSVLGTFGLVIWRRFARLRHSHAQSLTAWRQALTRCVGLGLMMSILMVIGGPIFVTMLTSGSLNPPIAIFASLAVLLIVQCIQLPSGAMLTTPSELAWQARWGVGAAVASVLISITLVQLWGPQGAALGAAAGVLLFQVLPNLLGQRRLLKLRSTSEMGGAS